MRTTLIRAGLVLALCATAAMGCDDSQPPISADTGTVVDAQTLDVTADTTQPDAPAPDAAQPDQLVPDQALPDAPLPDQAPSCTDGVKNGTESDVDCGGGTCAPCPGGKKCFLPKDCQGGVCAAGTCAAPSCTDKVKNGTETDVDCGGTCAAACADGKDCMGAPDCVSGVCLSSGKCAAPSCTDKVKNGTETDVDCGGTCAPCAGGKACFLPGDCTSKVCLSGKCAAATCSDKVTNGTETDADCGGICPGCAAGKICKVTLDCISGVCTAGKCVAATCSDMVKNGAEIDVDCGGGSCPGCAAGKICTATKDCISGVCTAGKCVAATCSDTVKNGTETDVDCGGGTCLACDLGKACKQNTDCASQQCDSGVCKSSAKALQKEVLADKPTGYWPLDETSGTQALDQSGNKRHGSYTGTCALGLTGKAGKAANLQGKCYVSFSQALTTFMSSSKGTVTALIKLPATWHKNTQSYPSHSMPIVFSNNAWYMGASVGTFAGVSGIHFWNFYTGGNDDRVAITAKAGTWAHVAWVHDGAKLYGYLNGVGKSVKTHGVTASMGKWIIGCCAGVTNYNYPSLMQHVATYSTALSASRIQAQAKAVGLYP